MQITESRGSWTERWCPEAMPEVDDVRPHRCGECGVPSRRGVRVIVHGHGIRIRTVVVLPAIAGDEERLGECWQRRYRCTSCGAVLVVLPEGVMPRYLYSAASIVVAFFLVERESVGSGMADVEAYERQGMYLRLSAGAEAEPCYRWRSLDRWAAMAKQWWPAWSGSVSSLLVTFVERSGGGDLEEVIRVAVDSHVGWGWAM